MIVLKIEKYCENCPHFEAETTRETSYDNSISIDYHTAVTCKSRRRCRAIYRHLEKAFEEENKNNIKPE